MRAMDAEERTNGGAARRINSLEKISAPLNNSRHDLIGIVNPKSRGNILFPQSLDRHNGVNDRHSMIRRRIVHVRRQRHYRERKILTTQDTNGFF